MNINGSSLSKEMAYITSCLKVDKLEEISKVWEQIQESIKGAKLLGEVALNSIPVIATIASIEKSKDDILNGKLKEEDFEKRISGKDFHSFAVARVIGFARLMGSNPNSQNVIVPLMFGGVPQTHVAVSMNDYNALRHIVRNGGKMDVEDMNGRYPIHYAFIDKGFLPETEEKSKLVNKFLRMNDMKIKELVLERTKDVNMRDPQGKTALHIAVEYTGNLDKESLEMLIKKGADLNSKDKNGKTPLNIASEKGDSKTYKLLMEYAVKKQNLSTRKEIGVRI